MNLQVCMYYHYQEIGRSANTAHVLEALLATRYLSIYLSINILSIYLYIYLIHSLSLSRFIYGYFRNFERLIFGEKERELKLINDIVYETDHNLPVTCMLLYIYFTIYIYHYLSIYLL
jgi:hypothetical protein